MLQRHEYEVGAARGITSSGSLLPSVLSVFCVVPYLIRTACRCQLTLIDGDAYKEELQGPINPLRETSEVRH